MEIIFVLLAISICLAVFFLISFIWASKSGQFDDTYGPSVRILFEDTDAELLPENKKNKDECK